ncbi:VIT domain-containing protein [Massilia forsythiae]|uniref:VIT domain-containing protein n=1 Tax=Massilia forsythiae TaxID=2728020 RepID=UPI001E618A67|nr:VIT domain-containing protein [Massilia forsythiae]
MPRILATLLLGACILCAPALAQSARRATPPPRPLLLAPDARTPIQLQQAGLAVDIGGGMAATTIELTFYNPNERVLEGELQFPLAPGQRVTGFALDLDGAMRPAVPVDKAKGRQVFEAIVRRGVDPALLETTQGDNLKLRVYPIPAHGTRRVRVQLAQALERASGRWTYRLPLPYAAGAGDIAAEVSVHSAAAAPVLPDALDPAPFQPAADGFKASLPRRLLANDALTIAGKADDGARAWTGEFEDESYFYAEIPVTTAPAPRALPRTMGLLWDSSGSGAARRHDLELAVLERYFRAAGDIDVALVRLRDRAEAPRTFRVRGGDWSALRRELEGTVYDGASALGAWTAPRLAGAPVNEYLLVSDGLDNYGARTFPTLLPSQRLFVLNAAPGADTGYLDALARRGNGRLVDIAPGAIDAAARALVTDGARIAALQGDGLADLQAESIDAHGGIVRVAGRRQRADALLRVTFAGGGSVAVPVTQASPRQPLAPLLWAGWRIDALQADYLLKRAEIARLGKRFGIATRDTSLIVLERLDDYVRHDIAPPPELRKAFAQMQSLRTETLATARESHLQRVLRELDAKQAWWETGYPKGAPPQPKITVDTGEGSTIYRRDGRSGAQPGDVILPPPPPEPAFQARSTTAPAPMMPAPAPAAPSMAYRSVQVSGSRVDPAAAARAQAQLGIALQKWTPDARYLDRLRGADAQQAYAIYLDQKPDFFNSSAFYLDVADLLFEKGQRDLALRVLSNLAEMDLENRQVLRILGYRLLQAGAPELAVPVFESVLRLAEDEPQSWRDLGLAYAAVGRAQEAADTLYQVVVREWDARFADVELITLADLNAVIAAARGKVDASRFDARLLRPMPLDLRAVLTWDADNSDMDLWVTDPNGERCMYANRLTYQGGQMSRDVTGGYGPEEFSLRDAKPGKYKVEANFYGHRQQLVASSTTLQLRLTTGFGTPRAQEQLVTLRLRGRGETVFVGEFEVGAAPAGNGRPARR